MLSPAGCSNCGRWMPDGYCPVCDPRGADRSQATTPVRRTPWFRYLRLIIVLINLTAWLVLSWVARNHRVAPVSYKHQGPVASLNELKGAGRIYLIQLGKHTDSYSIADFAEWLHQKYALDVRVLPPAPLDPAAWDKSRHQFMAEVLYDQIKRDHPDLAADPNTYLIGFTDADMYSVWEKWTGSFTQRDHRRAAIISSAGMQDPHRWFGRREDPALARQHFQARLRRILLKDVAVLYWHLPVNNDPTSLLHGTLNVDLPTEDLWESDLNSARTRWGESWGEPCIFFHYSAANGIQRDGNLIHTCATADDPQADDSIERFEVDLRLGDLATRHTDLSLSGAMPIRFERVLRAGWGGPDAFGVNGSDSYDAYLASADNIRIEVVQADGSRYNLDRTPRWISDLSMAKYIDGDYSGGMLQMRWHTAPFPHYELKRYDGEVETYLPCLTPDVNIRKCYLDGVRDAQGRQLTFQRNDRRKLLELTSTDNTWLRVTHTPGDDRIARIDDSRGRSVIYTYNGQDQLTTVTYSSGENLHYTWDDKQHLLTFSASPNTSTPPKILLSNEYTNGLIAKQTLAGGGVYTYSYLPANQLPVRGAKVQTPDGRTFQLATWGSGSTLWELPPAGSHSAVTLANGKISPPAKAR